MQFLLLTHLATTLIMVGIIWFVQVVHYPLFSQVGTAGFSAYSDAHSRLTTYVVGPPMLVQAASAILLVFVRHAGVLVALTALFIEVEPVDDSRSAQRTPGHPER